MYKKNCHQQQFGKMAEKVLKREFSFQMKFSAKMKVSASKSATSPSCETLCFIARRHQEENFRVKLKDFE